MCIYLVILSFSLLILYSVLETGFHSNALKYGAEFTEKDFNIFLRITMIQLGCLEKQKHPLGHLEYFIPSSL